MGVEADFDALDGDLVHHLSHDEVLEAQDLGELGYQRLRPLSEPGRTFFYFSTSVEGHAEVQAAFRISARICPETGYCSSDVDGGYWPCCDQVADQDIKRFVTLIYDVCVRADRKSWDPAAHLQRLPSKGSAFCCTSELPALPIVQPSDQYHQPCDARATAVHESPTVRPSKKNKRMYDGDNNLEGLQRSNVQVTRHGIVQVRPKKSERASTDEELANSLINQIKRGMQSMRVREEPFNPFDKDPSLSREQIEHIKQIQALHSKVREIQSSDEPHPNDQEVRIETFLTEIDRAFGEAEGKAKKIGKEAGIRQWWCWYFSSCVRIVLRTRGQVGRDRKANGAQVIHLIVNDLLKTEGVKALAVIAALAEQAHRLWTVAFVSHNRQIVISTLVARGLKDMLESPPQQYRIPIATVIVSIITGVSRGEASRVLGYPELAMLQLDDFWDVGDTPVWSKAYSFLSDKWKASQETRPAVRAVVPRKCNPPPRPLRQNPQSLTASMEAEGFRGHALGFNNAWSGQDSAPSHAPDPSCIDSPWERVQSASDNHPPHLGTPVGTSDDMQDSRVAPTLSQQYQTITANEPRYHHMSQGPDPALSTTGSRLSADGWEADLTTATTNYDPGLSSFLSTGTANEQQAYAFTQRSDQQPKLHDHISLPAISPEFALSLEFNFNGQGDDTDFMRPLSPDDFTSMGFDANTLEPPATHFMHLLPLDESGLMGF